MRPDSLGKKGEELAERYLTQKGYRLVCRNYRCRAGEIDLIVQKEDVLCFVEVKTRSSSAFGLPHEAVDEGKQKKLTRAALVYLSEYPFPEHHWRMDVVEILSHGQRYFLRHLENAFPFFDEERPPRGRSIR